MCLNDESGGINEPCGFRAELTKKDKGTKRDKSVIKVQTQGDGLNYMNSGYTTGRPRRASIFSIKLIVYSFRETLSD